ncbi:hypothetical protein MB02_04435 [Croceicoccus estronivorus]|nr:hypothetical protein MB02_04435 [Croceicoccus estronivorus]
MGRQERILSEYKALRDAAHAAFRTNLDLVRSEFAPEAIAQRAGEKASALSSSATETIKHHRGALVGGIAAATLAATLVFWLRRSSSQGENCNDVEGDNDEDKEIS